jgi:subtilisin family serine protease
MFAWDDAKTADIIRPSHSPVAIADSSAAGVRFKQGEVIVKFRDGASTATVVAAHAEMGARTMKTFSAGANRLHQLKLGKGVSVEDAITRYRQHPAVEYAEPNYIYQLAGIPNDPLFNQLWGLHNTGQTVRGVTGIAGADIHASEAWDITTGSPNVIIAVIDTGIAYDHPDLAPNMWRNPGETPNDGIDNDRNGFVDDYYGYDFFNNDSDPMDVVAPWDGLLGHGTGLSGTMAAVGNNSIGITGVMHTARLMALKAGSGLSREGVTAAAFIPAGNYAISMGARVINASFGRLGGACSVAEYSMLSAANAAGIMVLAAAGNSTQDNDIVPWYPAQYSVATACGPALPNVIAVAASDQNDELALFSSFGATSVQIASPGTDETYSTYPTPNVNTVLLHNFDSNPTGLGYTFSGITNTWEFTNSASLSQDNSLTDSPAGNYLSNTNSLATGPAFSTVGQHGCLLVGALRLAFAGNNDGILVQASGDGGATWTSGNTFSSSTGGIFHDLPLEEVRDGSLMNQFRFNMFSDASGNDDGAYLDDVRVTCVAGAPSGNTDYGYTGGTSAATAHVTGVVGLLLAAYPNLTVAEIRNAILNTGDVLPALAGKTSTGRRLNARAALDSVTPFAVTVNKTGTGTGLVTSTPTGINCGPTCNLSFPGGSSVTLTATPTAGSVFFGWNGGGCTGLGTCVLSTTAAVMATFNTAPPPQFFVTVIKAGTGTGTVTSTPIGINCAASCTAQFSGGTTVTLTPTPDGGSVFAGWSGGSCAGTGICQATIDATVTATFNAAPPTPFTVTVNKNGTGAGIVTSSPAAINCGGTCNAQFNQGTTVTLTATPTAGSVFASWSGGCTGTSACQVAATVTVMATFNTLPPPGTFTVTTLKGGTGSGSVVSAPQGIDCPVTCSANFLQGTTVILTAAADAGSTFAGWSGSGCTGTGLCNVSTAATVTAIFDGPATGGGTVQNSSGGGGGCTIAQAGTNDALMSTLFLASLVALVWKVRRRPN